MITANQTLDEFKYGTKLQGSNTSVGIFYGNLCVTSSGTTAANVFGSATAPTAGTITGFFTSAGGTTAGTVTLYGTTAGTLAVIAYGTTVGLITGTGVISGAVVAGDTVTVTGSTAGTSVCYVTFQTAS